MDYYKYEINDLFTRSTTMPEPKEKGNLEKCAREVYEHIEAVNFVYGPELKLDNFSRNV